MNILKAFMENYTTYKILKLLIVFGVYVGTVLIKKVFNNTHYIA